MTNLEALLQLIEEQGLPPVGIIATSRLTARIPETEVPQEDAQEEPHETMEGANSHA